MKHFLLVYHRPTGTLREQTEFDDGDAALEARFERERRWAGDRDVEVVVLTSDSLATVKKTHGRYFMPARAAGVVPG